MPSSGQPTTYGTTLSAILCWPRTCCSSLPRRQCAVTARPLRCWMGLRASARLLLGPAQSLQGLQGPSPACKGPGPRLQGFPGPSPAQSLHPAQPLQPALTLLLWLHRETTVLPVGAWAVLLCLEGLGLHFGEPLIAYCAGFSVVLPRGRYVAPDC